MLFNGKDLYNLQQLLPLLNVPQRTLQLYFWSVVTDTKREMRQPIYAQLDEQNGSQASERLFTGLPT